LYSDQICGTVAGSFFSTSAISPRCALTIRCISSMPCASSMASSPLPRMPTVMMLSKPFIRRSPSAQ
jgi:hypothetical protein